MEKRVLEQDLPPSIELCTEEQALADRPHTQEPDIRVADWASSATRSRPTEAGTHTASLSRMPMPFATVRHAPAPALVVVALMAGCHSSLRHVPVDAAAPGPGAEPPVPVIDSGFEAVAIVADATPNVSLDGTGNPNNGSTTSDGGAAAPVAPRDPGMAVPPESMAPAGTTDGCAYSRVTAKGLEFQLQSTHYAALATIDYDYRSVTSIRYKSGGDASSRLTPLSVTNTARVLTDKIGQPIDEFYLAGTCNQEGLCTVTGCEAYVFWL